MVFRHSNRKMPEKEKELTQTFLLDELHQIENPKIQFCV